jgi:hypothetical protein
MTRLSRPFQIALVVSGLFVAVWFVGLRGHSAGTGATASVQQVSPVRTPAPSPGAPSKVYHGSAPGLEGLTRDVAKAHGAVLASERNAKQLEQKSAHASGSASASSRASAALGARSHHVAPSANQPATARPDATSKAARKGPGATTTRARATPAMQARVESELKADGTVILLFWSPTGAEDTFVRHQLQALQGFHQAVGLPQNRHIAFHVALAKEVAAFGSITRAVQISATPTLLIITRGGRTKTVTGLLDAYSIQQAISEARQ